MIILQRHDPEQDEHPLPAARPHERTGQRHLGEAQDHDGRLLPIRGAGRRRGGWAQRPRPDEDNFRSRGSLCPCGKCHRLTDETGDSPAPSPGLQEGGDRLQVIPDHFIMGYRTGGVA